MIFDHLKFYIKDSDTGELNLRFLCDDCRKEMDRPYYTYENLRGKDAGYHFLCKWCYDTRKEYGNEFVSIKEHLERQKENDKCKD